MAGKLIPLAEAAEMLGISAEELTEMRSRGEIHGYRDGASWKFKDSEIERVAAELGGGSEGVSEDSMAALDGGESTFEGDLADLVDLDAEMVEGSSILVSDAPQPTAGASSIIGGDNVESDGDSDIKLAADSDLNLESSDLQLAGSDVGLTEGGSGAHDSDVALAADDQGSDVKLVAGDSGEFTDSDFVTDSDVLAEDSGDQKIGTGDTGRITDSDLALGSADDDDDALELASGDSLALGDDDLLLDEESAIGSSAGSALDLDDDEMVLGGSGIGSDVTLGTGDSGIGLANPSESGLDLEDATLDLGGSAVESLELPEDEDDDVIALEEEADPDAATQLKADDEFLLTPVEGDDEEDESGSQVIALEDSGAYDAEAATMLGGEAPGGQALVAEESDMFGQQLAAYSEGGGAGAAQPMPMQAPMPMAASGPPEAPYSVLNVLSLMAVSMILLVAGLLMVDLVNSMWTFQEVGDAQTTIMDAVVGAFFGNG